MKIGSKVLVRGSYFSHVYKGEVVGESEENSKSIWIVLVRFPKLDIELKSVKSSFFKDSLNSIHIGIGGFYIEEVESD